LAATLQRWLALYRLQARAMPPPRTQDQASFRAAIFGSRLSVATLPPEYNCRFPYPSAVCGEVKILHGHAGPRQLELSGKRLSRTKMLRVITPEKSLAASVILKS